MIILALDLATRVGFAVGDTADGPTVRGAHDLPRTGERVGRFLAAYDHWLLSMLDKHRPDIVVVEKPVMGLQSNLWTRIKLDSLVGFTEYRCECEEVRCAWADNNKVKKFFAGRGGFGKSTKPYPMTVACEQRGWRVETSDEADACGIWAYAAACYEPDTASQWDPLMRGGAAA